MRLIAGLSVLSLLVGSRQVGARPQLRDLDVPVNETIDGHPEEWQRPRSLAKRAVPKGVIMDRVGTVATGGCKDYETEMDDAYDEVIQIAQAAVNAIDMLKLPKPRMLRSSNDDTFNRLMQFEKAQTMMLALFGVKVPDFSGGPAQVTDSLDDIRNTFQQILNSVSDNPTLRRNRKRLYCGDGMIIFVAPGTIIPGMKDIKTGTEPPFDQDTWILVAGQSVNPEDNIPWSRIAPIPPSTAAAELGRRIDTPICDPLGGGTITYALTGTSDGFQFYCETALRRTPRLQDAFASVPSDGSWNWEASDPTTLSRIMLHEHLHLFAARNDVNAVYFKDGQVVIGSNGAPRRLYGRAYGYEKSYMVARHVPSDVPKNVDNFVYFAMSMYLDRFEFETETGVARLLAHRP